MISKRGLYRKLDGHDSLVGEEIGAGSFCCRHPPKTGQEFQEAGYVVPRDKYKKWPAPQPLNRKCQHARCSLIQIEDHAPPVQTDKGHGSKGIELLITAKRFAQLLTLVLLLDSLYVSLQPLHLAMFPSSQRRGGAKRRGGQFGRTLSPVFDFGFALCLTLRAIALSSTTGSRVGRR